MTEEDMDRLLFRLRMRVATRSQAWLTHAEARMLLERLDRRCDECGAVTAHEPVRVFCDGCVSVRKEER